MAYSGLLTDYLGEGLAADRPASPNLSPGACGVYYSTDTDVTSIWDGSTWHDLGSAGTVSSVALALPSSILTVSGSPVTATGTLTGTLATQTANEVWAGPATGSAAAPTFRALTAADLPLGTTSDPGALQPDGTTITVSGGVISATGAAAASVTSFRGSGYVVPFARGTINATAIWASAAFTANAGRCIAVRIPFDCTLAATAFCTTSSAGAKFIFALYHPDTVTGIPGNLAYTFTELDLSSTGQQTSTAQNVAAGDYWCYYNTNSATSQIKTLNTAGGGGGFIVQADIGAPVASVNAGGGITMRLDFTQTYSATPPSSLSSAVFTFSTGVASALSWVPLFVVS